LSLLRETLLIKRTLKLLDNQF